MHRKTKYTKRPFIENWLSSKYEIDHLAIQSPPIKVVFDERGTRWNKDSSRLCKLLSCLKHNFISLSLSLPPPPPPPTSSLSFLSNLNRNHYQCGENMLSTAIDIIQPEYLLCFVLLLLFYFGKWSPAIRCMLYNCIHNSRCIIDGAK